MTALEKLFSIKTHIQNKYENGVTVSFDAEGDLVVYDSEDDTSATIENNLGELFLVGWGCELATMICEYALEELEFAYSDLNS